MQHFTWFNLIPFLDKYTSPEFIHVVTAGFIVIVCMFLSIVMYRKFKKIKRVEAPDSKLSIRTIFELIGQMLLSLATNTMGEKNAKKFFPMLAAVFLFVFLNNLLSLIPGFIPATYNINTTLACGAFIFIYYNFIGFREHGLSYLKHFFGPVLWLAPLMLPIEFISHAVRPFSLGLRLFGNIMGDHLMLGIFSDLAPIGVPIIFLGFGLFVCFFQALIFVLLSMIYLTLALSEDH